MKKGRGQITYMVIERVVWVWYNVHVFDWGYRDKILTKVRYRNVPYSTQELSCSKQNQFTFTWADQ